MHVINLSNDLSAESIELLCESLQAHLDVPVRASDAAVLTGLPIETAREALASLAIRNNARTTTIGGDLAYIFKRVTPSGRRTLPPAVRRVGRYFGDLLTSQFGYLLGAMVLIGPTFVGARMVELGLEGDLFLLIAGGTIALACATLLLKLAVRSISVVLPPLVIAGIAMGWERWTAEDLYWIPLAVLVAIGLQLEVLWNYRKLRPKDPIALFLWGKTFTSPVRDHKRVVELILQQHGTVTTADLIRTFGWTEDHASEQLSNVIAEFGGDVAVDQDGDIFVFFEELSRTKQSAEAAQLAYERETEPPSPFEGLDLRWVSAASVACWLALVASPMNPAYIRFVGDLDFTLSGIPFIVRTIFAGFCVFPLLLYLGRIIFNALDRDEFKKRRVFLDALAYADKHAEGSHVGHDKFTNAQLAELGAEIDEHRSVENALWVSFPSLQTKSAPQNITEYFLDLSSEDRREEAKAESVVQAQSEVRR